MRKRWLLVLAVGTLGVLGAAGAGRAQEEVARALARLPRVFGEPTIYQRQGTESIYEIARHFGVSASALYNANVGDLLEGDEVLLIPTEHVAPVRWVARPVEAPEGGGGEVAAEGLVVNLTERNAYWYQGGEPVRAFPVAIGMRGWETPTGEFTIVNRRKNPTWFPPKWALEEKPVPPGPDNPLGDRWMGLSEPGYGLHATNAPSSVGRYVSHGCLRMYPEHAHELYELVGVGTPVQIIYERVVFGFRPEEGMVYMAYYPDPYRLREVRPEDVREWLEEYGLEEVVDMEAVGRALERPRGTPEAVVGSRTQVRVNGRPVKFALGPVGVGGEWLVAAGPLVGALGAEVEFGPKRNYVVVKRGEERIFFSPGDAEALVNGQLVKLEAAAQLAAGHPMIPLKATAQALGASVGWEQETGRVLVWDVLGKGRGAGVGKF
jgi:L,D-transpeptidase ErfK/SrfK